MRCFISQYFILFDAIVNGIVFSVSLSDSSLLMYRNAIDFHILIFNPLTLLNEFNDFFLIVFCSVFEIFCVYSDVICEQ